ncbi:MAG: hypothetical protein ABEI75_02250, partial [Halobaculum sp.]
GMELFEAPDRDAQVRGAAIVSVLEGVPAAFESRAERILADHGIENLDPEGWYAMQSYLDAYRTIVEEIGEVTLRQIGRTTPETAEWPPGVETPLDALQSIDDAYRMNHRGEGIGSYDVTETAEGARVVSRTPYPCEYEVALVKGTAERFADGPVTATPTAEDGTRCVFDVSW